MRERVEQRVRSLLVSQLLAAGLLLPVLAILGVSSWWQTGCVYLALVTLGMQLLLFLPHGRACAWGAAGVLTAAWMAAGGLQTLQEVLRGVFLALQGRNLAIPLIADRAVPLLGVGAALLACLSAGDESEGVLASILTIGAMYAMLAYGDASRWYLLLPAAGATVFLLANGMRGDMGRIRIAALAAGLCLLVFLLVPRGGLTVQPLKETADAIRQKIEDYFFFTQPRTMFTLATEGYYPMGGDQLGGPANPTDHPVMTVVTPRKVYLRGAVKDHYTGRTWLDTLGDTRYLWVSPQWEGLRDTTFDMALPAEELPASRIRVDMAGENASDLFVPQRVRGLSVSSDMVPYFNRGSGLFITRNLQEGDVYTVSAVTALAGDAGLEEVIARAASRGDPARDAEIASVYLNLPDHLQQQVHDLARTAAGDAATPYGKVMAIRSWLQANCRYNLDVPEQNPNQDFVSTFLLVTREGYCTYFASAMTVMCRMVGVPARYVEGYTAEPGADGIAHVTGKNGHAWTEIWLSGYGWLTIDATGFEDRDQPLEDPEQNPEQDPEQPPDQPPAVTPTPPPQGSPEGLATPTPAPEKTPPEDEPDREPPFPWLWAGLFVLLLLLLLLILLGRAHVRRMRPENLAAREPEEAGRWSVWMQAVCDALQVLGETRPRQLSMAQWLREVDGRHLVSLELAPLGECAAVVFYGQMEPLAEETGMAREAYSALHGVLNRRQRFRLAVLRLRRRPWRP